MTHWQQVMGDRILTVNYEALVADNEATVRQMIEFIGLEWDERCLKHADNTRAVVTASSDQATKPLYTSSIERWRHYESQLQPLKRVLAGECSM